MNKLDKDKAFAEFIAIFDETAKSSSALEMAKIWINRVPDFLSKIWEDGYVEGFKAGIEEGKRQKIENLTKQN